MVIMFLIFFLLNKDVVDIKLIEELIEKRFKFGKKYFNTLRKIFWKDSNFLWKDRCIWNNVFILFDPFESHYFV